ncbi:MAG TPA: FAD binding domain-containing protein [Vicinamibacteria bacterium]|jgi:4-hydroxybenzoyl-CoA reductase subunit beta|nr:FAD binding domain-containing protein [Vicinamibacteria bacterium]
MMRLPPFRYIVARTAREAATILADHGPEAMAVAGGTDLLPNMKRRQFEPKILVGLRGIAEAEGISPNGGLRLGALATLTEVAEHRVVGTRWPSLARSAGLVSSPPLRNAGTIGGNLCVDTRCNYYNQSEFWRASVGYCMKKDGDICLVAPGSKVCWALSSSDTAPVMISLEAEVTLVGPQGARRVPARSLYGPDGIHYLAKSPEEILTQIHVPAREGWLMTYRKLRRRGSIDFPILGVAAAVRLVKGRVEEARIVLGAVHVAPVEAKDAQEFLRGKRLDIETIEMASGIAYKPAKPLDNADLVYSWRKRMARIEVARALRELAGLPTGDLPPIRA